MGNYATLSIETHLFFARIMKEHSLFLEAGFPCCEKEWIERADFFRQRFEALLEEVLEIAEGNVHKTVLDSCELATEFTAAAEQKTEALSGIPINTGLTRAVCILRSGRCDMENNAVNRRVMQINRRAHSLLNGLIHFKEQILFGMREGRLFTTNYPLLIEHIIREAKLYRSMVGQLLSGKRLTNQSFCETEVFWNQIMMEHAWFIRGLLDPSEAQLIKTADDFSKDYARLLEKAREQSCRANGLTENSLTQKTLKETLKYREFKEAGTKGILNSQISSIILPLLADHVLREANHYIRILENNQIC